MGKKKQDFDDEEMRADLEKRIDEDYFDDDEFYGEDEDDLYDEDNFDPSYYQAVFNVLRPHRMASRSVGCESRT